MWSLIVVILVGGVSPSTSVSPPGPGTNGQFVSQAQCQAVGAAHVAALGSNGVIAVASCAKAAAL